MIFNNFMSLLRIAIVLFCLILIFIGFVFGYIYSDYKSGTCAERPFSYGVGKLNEMNNVNFTCSCSALGVEPFSFNEDGLVNNNLFIVSP